MQNKKKSDLFALATEIIGTSAQEITLKLIPKHDIIPLYALVFFGVSFGLLALAKLTGKQLISTHTGPLFSTIELSNFLRDGLKFVDLFTIALILNTHLCTGYACYLTISTFTKNLPEYLILVYALVSLGLQIWQYLIAGTTLMLTNEREACTDHMANTTLTYPIRGILLLPILIYASFNPNQLQIAVYGCLLILGIMQIVRIIRCFIYALKNSVPLYYIILYFCTLEILPLVVLYYYFIVRN